MTLVRRLAVRVAEFVARHASAGSREWAEGIAREVGEIAGDWAALGWALGSLRVLVDYQWIPVRTLAQVYEQAAKYIESKHDRKRLWLGQLVIVFIQLSKLRQSANVAERAGTCAMLVGWIWLVALSYAEWRRAAAVPPYDDLPEIVRFYRKGLEGTWRRCWEALPAVSLLCLGSMVEMQFRSHPKRFLVIGYGVMWVAAMAAAAVVARLNRTRLRQVDAVLHAAE